MRPLQRRTDRDQRLELIGPPLKRERPLALIDGPGAVAHLDRTEHERGDQRHHRDHDGDVAPGREPPTPLLALGHRQNLSRRPWREANRASLPGRAAKRDRVGFYRATSRSCEATSRRAPPA